MPFDVREKDLSGTGKRFEIDLDQERSVGVMIYGSGERELYYREYADEEYEKVTNLSDTQARTLGLLLAGAYYQPIATHKEISGVLDRSMTDETLEGYTIHQESPLAGERLGDAKLLTENEISVIAIQRGSELIKEPDRDQRIKGGDRLVCLGTPENHGRFEQQLVKSS